MCGVCIINERMYTPASSLRMHTPDGSSSNSSCSPPYYFPHSLHVQCAVWCVFVFIVVVINFIIFLFLKYYFHFHLFIFLLFIIYYLLFIIYYLYLYLLMSTFTGLPLARRAPSLKLGFLKRLVLCLQMVCQHTHTHTLIRTHARRHTHALTLHALHLSNWAFSSGSRMVCYKYTHAYAHYV